MKRTTKKEGIWFRISGFLHHEIGDIIYRKKQVSQTLREQKRERQGNRRLVKNAILAEKAAILEASRLNRKVIKEAGFRKKNKADKTAEQIQRGFDLAAKWKKE